MSDASLLFSRLILTTSYKGLFIYVPLTDECRGQGGHGRGPEEALRKPPPQPG